VARKKRKKKAAGSKKATKRRTRRSTVETMPIDQLEAVLDRRKREALQQERRELADRLAEVERELAELGAAPAKRGRKKKAAKKKGRGRKGPRGGATLGNKLAQILGGAGGPMKLVDIVQAVEKSDYSSKSKYLRSMINQTLSKDSRFKKVRRGTYKLG
jgi:hypothetical protein